MTSSNKSRSKSRSKSQPAQSRGRSRTPRPGTNSAAMVAKKPTSLDVEALKYAKILKDPCYAPLAHPLYPGGEGGVLMRAETHFTFGNAATDTAGVFIWAPGCIGPTSATGVFVAANDSTATILSNGGSGTYVPGLSFLQSNASSCRIVSACITLMWPGTELNRQGFVSIGQVNASLITEGLASAVLSPANLRPLLQVGVRVPASAVEVRFRPFSGDATWTDPSNNDSTPSQNGAIAVAFSNLPVATGLRFKLTAVYEYVPKYAQGQATPVSSRNRSRHTENEVINLLDQKDPQWWHSVGQMAGSLYQGFMSNKMTRDNIAY